MMDSDLKPISSMNLDHPDIPEDVRWEDYTEKYFVDVNDEQLEKILEDAMGRFEMDGNVVTRYPLEWFMAKSSIPSSFTCYWGRFLQEKYVLSLGSCGILYENRKFSSLFDLSFFDYQQARSQPKETRYHMMQSGRVAQRWCLRIEFDCDIDKPHRGYAKIRDWFTLVGDNNTQIEEIWMVVVPLKRMPPIQRSKLWCLFPSTTFTQEKPPADIPYIVVCIRSLDTSSGLQHLTDDGSYVVGYIVIEPNMKLEVPKCSLLYGAPSMPTRYLYEDCV